MADPTAVPFLVAQSCNFLSFDVRASGGWRLSLREIASGFEIEAETWLQDGGPVHRELRQFSHLGLARLTFNNMRRTLEL